MKCAIGIDLGATNIKGLAVTRTGRVLAEVKVPTLAGGPRCWRDNVGKAVRELERSLGHPADCVGLAAPGLPADDQLSIVCLPERLPGIEGLVWEKHLGSPGSVPVLNDGHAALLGELWRGAARGSKNVILLTLGTGVGGAAVVDGHLLRGHHGRAGHFGHISLNPTGDPDITGMPGSLEMAIGDCTVADRTGGEYPTNHELLVAARKGNRQARAWWNDSVRALAAGVASLINVLSPELVVLGGGTAKAGQSLFRPLARFLDQFEWRPEGARARIVPAKLGDRAGAFGAAYNALGLGPLSVWRNSPVGQPPEAD